MAFQGEAKKESPIYKSERDLIYQGKIIYNISMKFRYFLYIFLTLFIAACAGNRSESAQERPDTGYAVIAEVGAMAEISVDEGLDRVETCYQEGVHPIGLSIAEQFEDITSYKEVMSWFCSGAEFEDILNALMTAELTGADGGDLLEMVADGRTWDEIWLELGIIKQ